MQACTNYLLRAVTKCKCVLIPSTCQEKKLLTPLCHTFASICFFCGLISIHLLGGSYGILMWTWCVAQSIEGAHVPQTLQHSFYQKTLLGTHLASLFSLSRYQLPSTILSLWMRYIHATKVNDSLSYLSLCRVAMWGD